MVILKRKLKKSKLTVLLGVLFLIFSGCEMNNTENPRLSDNDLEEFLNSNVDFANFIERNKTSTIELDSKIKKLSPSEIEQFKTVFAKYDNYRDFVSNAKTNELQLFKTILPSDNQSDYLKKIMDSLRKFEYSKSTLVEIISTKVAVINESYTNGKVTADCAEIKLSVYIQVLNYNYFELGNSIESSDTYASTASSWAYYGCVMGQL